MTRSIDDKVDGATVPIDASALKGASGYKYISYRYFSETGEVVATPIMDELHHHLGTQVKTTYHIPLDGITGLDHAVVHISIGRNNHRLANLTSIVGSNSTYGHQSLEPNVRDRIIYDLMVDPKKAAKYNGDLRDGRFRPSELVVKA